MLFEPAHGSAPSLAGTNQANPGAMILTAALMLENTGYPKEGMAIKQAFADVLAAGRHTTHDVGGTATTAEMGSAIARRAAELLSR
jgi:tartrate dehydrogenase/decarboxylase/D-malate dehydrogenase